MDLNKLLTRTISGLVYAGIIIGCIFWGTVPFNMLAAVFAALAVYEFEKISGGPESRVVPFLLMDILGAVCLVFVFGGMFYPLLIWVVILLFRMILQLYVKSDTPLADIARSFMSQLYVGLPLGLMVLLAYMWHLHSILAIFLMIWLNDTGAFLVGSAIGRHRLFERISPKKSWEGFFGGLLFVMGAAAMFGIYGSEFFVLSIGLGGWLGLGVVVCVFSTWGDLVESMMKRSLHIKDFGNLIPGHGGILDRIDSLLFVMPASLIYLFFLGNFQS